MPFKDRLRRELQAAGVSPKEAASRAGVSVATVYSWLNGHHPRLDRYERLLEVFPELREPIEVAS